MARASKRSSTSRRTGRATGRGRPRAVLVTGAAQGIGRAIARRLLDGGMMRKMIYVE
jgi:NADP-dependent 3-hydroxy acid dehydrogenase YdfG